MHAKVEILKKLALGTDMQSRKRGILFDLQREQAAASDESDNGSPQHHDKKEDELQLNHLKGFRATSEIDEILLQGIFPKSQKFSHESPAEAKEDRSPNVVKISGSDGGVGNETQMLELGKDLSSNTVSTPRATTNLAEEINANFQAGNLALSTKLQEPLDLSLGKKDMPESSQDLGEVEENIESERSRGQVGLLDQREMKLAGGFSK